jgi:hypothetical protein
VRARLHRDLDEHLDDDGEPMQPVEHAHGSEATAARPARSAPRFVHTAEKMRLLPRGFARFEETFISGNVSAIIEAGRRGLLDGASLMLWRKS